VLGATGDLLLQASDLERGGAARRPGFDDTDADFDDLDELFETIDASDEPFDGLGERGEEFTGVGVAERGLAGVCGFHEAAAGEHPFATDAKGFAKGLKEFDVGSVPTEVPTDGFWVCAGGFGDGAAGTVADDLTDAFMESAGVHETC